MRSRIAKSAAYFHPFEIGSVPVQVAAPMICSNYTDEKTGSGYIRLANGKPNAASGGPTEGYSIRLPDTVEAAASGRLVSLNVVARAAGDSQSRFALAYSTNDVGNSGWRWHKAGPEWSVFTTNYVVPLMNRGNGDFVGILPDAGGRPGTEFCYLSVKIRPKDTAELANAAKHWLREEVIYHTAGGIVGYIIAAAAAAFWAFRQYRAAELCTALCLIALLLWLWVMNLPALVRGFVAALAIGAGLWVVLKVEDARTQPIPVLKQQLAELNDLKEG